ncbi:hypothetical protein UPYG_G00037700 [Umbra pygmaea]|uniref:A-kinase anchor protein 2 C-terminal domain-containing protein n=1 Tax=Umbra pygmaea TaxID=75934 RepID=A0ABD0Y2V3_UMBPY
MHFSHFSQLTRLSVAAPDDCRDVLTPEKGDLIVCHSHQLPASESSPSPQEDTKVHGTMESSPRRWVLQPMSPKLEPTTDLRTMLSPTHSKPFSLDQNWNGNSSAFSFDSISVSRMPSTVVVSSHQKDRSSRDVVVQARQVAISEEDDCNTSEDWQPSSPSCPSSPGSTGSHRGFYSFVDDPASPEAELNEAWMLSPERQAMLATLKEEHSFKLQTYTSGKKPGSLFEEDEDSLYQVNTGDGDQLKAEEEEKKLRQEIIHGQAPKKTTFREEWSVLENLDVSKPPKKLLEGFSLFYSPKSTNNTSTEHQTTPTTKSDTIDNNQINFSAVREQFLKMERMRLNSVLQSPRSPKPQGRPWQSEDNLLSPRSNKEMYHSTEWLNQSPTQMKQQYEGEVITVRKVKVKYSTEERVLDDLDSALEDLTGNPSIGHPRNESTSIDNPQPESKDAQLASCYRETPIEREIRNAQEREESLRRSRGIKHTDVQEMVEIKTKPLLSQPPPPLTPIKAKEKHRVSFFIQREIEKDSQREEDLLQQGIVPGLYDRGASQELEEKKKIFELPYQSGDEDEKRKSDGSLPGVFVSRSSNPEGFRSPCSPHWNTEEKDRQFGCTSSTASINNTSKGYGTESKYPNKAFSSTFSKENITLNNQETTKTSSPQVMTTSTSKVVNDISWLQGGKHPYPVRSSLAKETFYASASSSPSSSTPTASSVQGSASSADLIPTWRLKLDSNGLRPRRQYAPDLIQKEIELDLKREQELRELRQTSGLSVSMDGNLDCVGQDVPDNDQSQGLPRVIMEQKQSISQSPSLPIEQTSLARWSYSSITPASMLESSPQSSTSICPPGRLPSISIVTAQPWGSPHPTSPVVNRVAPLLPTSPWVEMSGPPGTQTHKGLTETLLEDFEERRMKLKLEENAYAGIQPTDDVNNEVLEATRVTRHKNMRALRWEAGNYTNEDGQ